MSNKIKYQVKAVNGMWHMQRHVKDDLWDTIDISKNKQRLLRDKIKLEGKKEFV